MTVMALSEEDQRKFDEIERGLLEQDPVFSTTTIDRLRRRRRWSAVASFCVGVLLLEPVWYGRRVRWCGVC
jgi:hypothetical protein